MVYSNPRCACGQSFTTFAVFPFFFFTSTIKLMKDTITTIGVSTSVFPFLSWEWFSWELPSNTSCICKFLSTESLWRWGYLRRRDFFFYVSSYSGSLVPFRAVLVLGWGLAEIGIMISTVACCEYRWKSMMFQDLYWRCVWMTFSFFTIRSSSSVNYANNAVSYFVIESVVAIEKTKKGALVELIVKSCWSIPCVFLCALVRLSRRDWSVGDSLMGSRVFRC